MLVNAVTAGPVESEVWTEAGGLADQIAARRGIDRDEVLASTRSRLPVGRMATPDEVAAAIVFLCSKQASNVSGAAWSVDGGAVPLIF